MNPQLISPATLANWRSAPYNRWAFQHVRELIPSAEIANDPLGGEIAAGCVVLMQRMHGDAIARRAGSLGQHLAKLVVPLVGDADPVDGAEDNRLAGAEDHDTTAA